MKMKTDGIATHAIGFGVHKQLAKTKQMADFYVTQAEQLLPLLRTIYDYPLA